MRSSDINKQQTLGVQNNNFKQSTLTTTTLNKSVQEMSRLHSLIQKQEKLHKDLQKKDETIQFLEKQAVHIKN